jgi:hypothetical protein
VEIQDIEGCVDGRFGSYRICIAVRDDPGIIQHRYRVDCRREIRGNGFFADIDRPGSIGLLAVPGSIKGIILVELEGISRKTIRDIIDLVIPVAGYTPGSLGNQIHDIVLFLLLYKFFTGEWNEMQEEQGGN